jgi:type IV pilus assembly protein PilQ
MKTCSLLLVASLAFFLLSCAHTTPPATPAAATGTTPAGKDAKLLETLKSAEHREVLKAASQRLDDTRAALKSGKLDEAEAGLQPLIGQSLFVNEVNELRTEIRQAKDKIALVQGKKEAEQRAFTEVEQRQTLPGTYGSTVTITGESGSFTLPPGPMEALFSKKVSLKVQNAGVKELVQALTQIEGLNIIADDALEAKKTLTVDVRNAPLSEILSYVARNMGIAFNLGENVVWVTASEEKEGGGPKLETHIYRLKQGFIPQLKPSPGAADGDKGGGAAGGAEDTDLEDALEAISADSPEGASYRVFRNRNLLMVRNSRENLRLIEKLIEDLDKPPRQVLIEARFLTISQEDLLEFGVGITDTSPTMSIDTNGNRVPPSALNSVDANDPTRLRAADFASTALGTFSTDNPAAGALTLGGVIGGRTYDLVIKALQKNNSTRTLSAPRITVLNNQSAHIRKGDTLKYWDTPEAGNAEGSATITAGDPKEVEVGVTLDVKVSIGNDGQTVLLGLQPEVKSILSWVDVPPPVVAVRGGNAPEPKPSKAPNTTESTLTTTVAVKSGETVVLGGMVSDTNTKTVKKIPYLGDIPYLGFLFRHTTDSDEPTHLLIFVTATVISDSGQFVKVQEAAK